MIFPALIFDASVKTEFVPKQLLLVEKFATGDGIKVTFKVSFVGLQPLLLVEVSINKMVLCVISEADGVYITLSELLPGLKDPVPVDVQLPVPVKPLIIPFKITEALSQTFISLPAITIGALLIK